MKSVFNPTARGTVIVHALLACLVLGSVYPPPADAAKKPAKRSSAPQRVPGGETEITGQAPASSEPLSLWYRRPASQWKGEALPVGNGRLGCMVFGGLALERLTLNEDTVWAGAPVTGVENLPAASEIPEVRRLLFEGKNAEAEALLWKIIEPVSRFHERFFGTSQVLGNLDVRFAGPAAASDYRRELDLDSAVARTRFVRDGVTFTREVFSSAPDEVIVARFAADKPGQVSFTAGLTRPERFATRADGDDTLVMSGRLPGAKGAENGLRYVARVKALAEGGKVFTAGDALHVEGADAATLFITAGTDYLPKPPDFRGRDCEKIAAEQLAATAGKSYENLKTAHLAFYRPLFRRVRLDLGGDAEGAKLPTDERLKQFQKDTDDPGLVALLFQYGRYLLISSSRAGCQPANLQGIWVGGLAPSWNADYHLDLNIQMNYWPAEVCNLSECTLPLADLVEWMIPSGRQTARVCHGAGGWAAHTVTNPFGFTWPRPDSRWGYLPGDGAWVMQPLWEHYAFTLDKEYLRRVWPLFREAGVFWLEWLVVDPKTGNLVSGPSSSPENSFIAPDGSRRGISMGPAYDQQCVWELFTEILDGAKALGIEDEYTAKVHRARSMLLGPQIGSDGRLLEWAREYKEADPHHRHRAHLTALYSGRQIAQDPLLSQAAARSLAVRGDCRVNWSMPWDAALNARLGRGEKSSERLAALLRQGVLPNLLGKGGNEFQIDSNFGAAAAVPEMLLQSHDGVIRALPALPKAWATGTVSGLRARGAYTVDMTWKDGSLTSLTVRADQDGSATVACGEARRTLTLRAGESVTLNGKLEPAGR